MRTTSLLVIALLEVTSACAAQRSGPAFEQRSPVESTRVRTGHDFDVRIRDTRKLTSTTREAFARTTSAGRERRGSYGVTSSGTVALTIERHLGDALDLPPEHAVLVDVRSLGIGLNLDGLDELAIASTYLVVTITSSTSTVVVARTSSWGRASEDRLTTSIVDDVVTAVVVEAIDQISGAKIRQGIDERTRRRSADVFEFDFRPGSPQPRLPRVGRFAGSYSFGLTFGVTQFFVPGGFDIVSAAPGSDTKPGTGISMDVYLRIPFADLRLGLGLRFLGGMNAKSLAQRYPDLDFDGGRRAALNLSSAVPLWARGDLEFYGVGEVSYESGEASTGPNAVCQTFNCRSPRVNFQGVGGHGGFGFAYYVNTSANSNFVIMLETKAGAIRWFDARSANFRDNVDFDTSNRMAPSISMDLRIGGSMR